MISRPVSAKRFVGRVRERAFFDERLDAAARGEGSIILLFGDAGIGKTRLLRERLAAAKPRNFIQAWARNLMHARAAFAPLSEAFATIAADAPKALPTVPAARTLIERFLGAFDDAEQGEGEWQKRRLFVLAGDLLARAARIRPVLLVVDDAQWSDPESLELLQYLASRIEHERVVLAIAAREEERRGTTAFADAITALERHSWCYRAILGELSDAETRELIFSALAAETTLPQRLVLEIVKRSEGNPLFAEDLVRDALDRGGDGTGLPQSVEQLVRRRLEQLDAEDAAAIEVAAAIGASFDQELFAEIAELGATEASRVLRVASDLGLVEPDQNRTGAMRFRHQLTCDAVYGRISPERRRDIHTRVATALERVHAPATELARHWQHAGDGARASRYAEQAGDEEMQRYAFGSARDHFEAALRHGKPDPAHEAVVFAKLAEAYNALGDPEAYDRYERALQYYRAQGDRTETARIAVRMAMCAWNLAKTDASFALVLEALDVAPEDEPARFAAAARAALFRAYVMDGPGALHYAAEAERFRGERPPEDIARLSLARASAFFHLGQVEEYQRAVDACIIETDALLNKRQLLVALINIAGYARELADLERAQRLGERAIEVADENGIVFFSSYARIGLADVVARRGDLPRAHELLAAAMALAVESPLLRYYATFTGIPIALAVDDAALAERLGDEELLAEAETAEPRHSIGVFAAFATLAAARNDTELARKLVSKIVRLGLPVEASTDFVLIARLADDKDLPAVAALLAKDEDYKPISRVEHALATALLAVRRTPNASRKPLFADALALARKYGMPLTEAEALEGAGEAAAALEIYRRCGAKRAVARLENRRTSGRATDGALTPREREIAELVAGGHSNKRIADVLFISERTAEHHVASIYSKLGIHSRVELAARISTQRNADDEREN